MEESHNVVVVESFLVQPNKKSNIINVKNLFICKDWFNASFLNYQIVKCLLFINLYTFFSHSKKHNIDLTTFFNRLLQLILA
jgi:hypothetical protein